MVIVSGGRPVDVPSDQPIAPVAASPSCLLVACMPEVDGDTELTIGTAADVDPGYAPGFVGQLETPRLHILVETIDDEIVLDQPVRALVTQIRIWFSHPRWPEKVAIGID
ncbi:MULTISPECIES: hypothetical protein [unclassified Bosea (in: a-proteobacteria)]|uniref:hypothetical protein n=1 Tax=unclassified Bosea (in: a-proteobacteria) TaxID=2653178 RepID=UPI00125EF8EE|nr:MULTISPECIES: hypothetical protein [unclassified Bosea (in: a-proteobacteria)]